MTFTYETRTAKDGTVTYSKTINRGNDPLTGKRRQTRVSAPSVRELKRLYSATVTQLDGGDYIEPSTVTIGEYLTRWLDTYAKHNVRATTYRSYEQLIRLHITPALGNVRLQKLTPVQLQAFYSDKLTTGRADGKPGGLSPRTVLHLHAVIREALHQAMRWQLVARNVADAVEPPRAKRANVQSWDADAALCFLDVARDDLYSPIWLLALTTGMRRGELLGLRWGDLDLTRGELHVRQSLVEVDGRAVFQEPKTASGRRKVALSDATVTALRSHRAKQNERRLSLGSVWRDLDLVFTVADGGPILPANLLRSYRRIVERAGVPAITFHGLRHTHATLLLKEGTHAKIVSERLGHANIGITLDTYSHVLPDMQTEAAKSIDRALFGT
ncbi:MAG: site-specific integrase [Chloroflexi bacterium]|nr:MAG: site-specific integrase [Chloroflexota bacterium]